MMELDDEPRNPNPMCWRESVIDFLDPKCRRRPPALDSGGLLYPGEFVVLSGAAGVGKTLFALRLALHCARRGACVVYMLGEARRAVETWIPRVWTGMGGTLEEWSAVAPRVHIALRRRSCRADEADEAVMEVISDAHEATPRGIYTSTLLVIDPLSSFLAGDENSTADVRAWLDALAEATDHGIGANAAALVLHHTNRDGRLRGSTVLDAAAEAVVRLDKLRDDARQLTWPKDRHGRREPLHYRMDFGADAIRFDFAAQEPKAKVIDIGTRREREPVRAERPAVAADDLAARALAVVEKAGADGITFGKLREALNVSGSACAEIRDALVAGGKVELRATGRVHRGKPVFALYRVAARKTDGRDGGELGA